MAQSAVIDVARIRRRTGVPKLAKGAGVLTLSMIAWTGVVGYGVLAGWWHRPLASIGDRRAFMEAAKQMVSSEPHGDLALVLVTNGEVTDEHHVSLTGAVTGGTVSPRRRPSMTRAASSSRRS